MSASSFYLIDGLLTILGTPQAGAKDTGGWLAGAAWWSLSEWDGFSSLGLDVEKLRNEESSFWDPGRRHGSLRGISTLPGRW